MKRLVLVATVLAVAGARPETYREKEDFQYSRSSSDEGSKSGYYGAQRGNMGGNFERAHNMDSLAQNQMSGVVRQVDSELGDASNTRTGSVFSAANTRGVYGSGHYDLSNLNGRNFQEGVSFGDSESQSSSAYRQSSSAAHNAYSRNQHSTQNGFDATGHANQLLYASNLQAGADRDNRANEYEYNRNAGTYRKGYSSQSGYRSESGYNSESATGQHSNYRSTNDNGSIRLVSAQPVRVILRPGTRVDVPVAAQTYRDSSRNTISSSNQHSVKDDAEVLANLDYQARYQTTDRPKHYESSYNYHKEWEKHDTSALPVSSYTSTSSPNSFPTNSELNEDTRGYHIGNGKQYQTLDSNVHSEGASNVQSSNAYRRFNSATSSQSQHQSDSQYGLASGSRSNAAYNSAGSGSSRNLINVDVDSIPKGYESAYSYHKSWERQGDPYVIRPASSNIHESDSLTSPTKNNHASYQYGSNNRQSQQSYSSNGDCDENGHYRAVRSADRNYVQQHHNNDNQQSQNQDVFGQQSQNLEEFGQQSQKLEEFGQQSQHGDDFGQQSQNLQDFGQQSQNLEEFGQHSQHGDDFGQQSQNLQDFGQQSQNLEEFGQQSQNQEDFGQQSQNLQDFGQQSQNRQDFGQQSQNLEEFGQQSQNRQDFGQQSQNLEEFGQQSQNQEEFGQQSQNLQDFGQQSQNLQDFGQHTGNFGQQGQHLEDFGQQTQNQRDIFTDAGQDFGQQAQNLQNTFEPQENVEQQTQNSQHHPLDTESGFYHRQPNEYSYQNSNINYPTNTQGQYISVTPLPSNPQGTSSFKFWDKLDKIVKHSNNSISEISTNSFSSSHNVSQNSAQAHNLNNIGVQQVQQTNEQHQHGTHNSWQSSIFEEYIHNTSKTDHKSHEDEKETIDKGRGDISSEDLPTDNEATTINSNKQISDKTKKEIEALNMVKDMNNTEIGLNRKDSNTNINEDNVAHRIDLQNENLNQHNKVQHFKEPNIQHQLNFDQMANFDQDNENLNQRDMEQQFEHLSFQHETHNQNEEQITGNFGQENDNPEQQNAEQQFEQFGFPHEIHNQQNVDQIGDFSQQNENLDQEHTGQIIGQHNANTNRNINENNYERQFEDTYINRNVNQQSMAHNMQPEPNFDQQNENLSQQSQTWGENLEDGQQVQLPWEPSGNPNTETQSNDKLVTIKNPVVKDIFYKENFVEQQNNNQNLEVLPPSKNQTETNQTTEPTTETPGFWKSVGNKFTNAKNKVASWFKS